MQKQEMYLSAIRQNDNINNNIQQFLTTTKKRYIYGSGLQVAVCLGIFRDMKIDIAGVILPPGASLSRLKGYWGRLFRKIPIISVQKIDDMEKRQAYVMMAVPREEYEAVQSYLVSIGVTDIIECCWKHNSDIMNICYDVWKKQEYNNE